MRNLSVLSLPLLAGCGPARDAVASFIASPDVAERIDEVGTAVSTGNWDGLLNILTVSGIVPLWVSGPVLALLAFKRSRGHLVGSVKSIGKAVGIGHSSTASEKAAKK